MNEVTPPVDYTDVSALGIKGLDNILCGGLTPCRLYLVEGVPGSGKTTLAMQYLLEGARKCMTALKNRTSNNKQRSGKT